ncbi:LRP2-binding protein-like [Oopsacas minuta]|uniref:LRP2-binding protein n=1 Tax=Oopsacas minuta TaxID=111878 RepID=A0AAV7K887_9METZ|nr:LRP2-binding protein-like [Oopsacas minuta]
MVDEIDEPVWLKQLEHLCELGLPQAHFQMGQYLCDNGSFSEAFDSFSKGTDLGSKDSEYQVGVMLFEGLGTEQNSKRGIELMKRIADTADSTTDHLRPNAQFHIGKAYYEGYGVWPDHKRAAEYWLLASEAGNVEAMNMLGFFYTRPDTFDIKKAFHWHRLAARGGSVESLSVLGVFLTEGQGSSRDLAQAFRCLESAADQGSAYAKGQLVYAYYIGQFYQKTKEKALEMLKFESKEEVIEEARKLKFRTHLACSGVSLAYFLLARCLSRGIAKPEGEFENLSSEKLYSKAHHFDREMAAQLQKLVTHGKI